MRLEKCSLTSMLPIVSGLLVMLAILVALFVSRRSGNDMIETSIINSGQTIMSATGPSLFNNLYNLDLDGLNVELRALTGAEDIARVVVRDISGQKVAEAPEVWEFANQVDSSLPIKSIGEKPIAVHNVGQFLVLSGPISVGSTEIGLLEIVFDKSSLQASLRSEQRQLLFLMIGLLIIASFLLAAFIRHAINPLRQLTAAAGEIGAGNMETSVSVKGSKEIVALAEVMEKMRANLKGFYLVLEQKVKDRTQDLYMVNQRLTRSNRELEGRNEIARIFVGDGEFLRKTVDALDILVTISNADWATVRLMRDSPPGLHFIASAGPAAQDFLPVPVIPVSETLAATAFTEGGVRVIDDYANHASSALVPIEMGVGSLVILPITIGERILGLAILVSRETNRFQPESVDLLSCVVDGLGVLMENAILHDISEQSRVELEHLTEELFSANKNIVQINESLEQRVMIRTKELEAANQRVLQAEKFALIGQMSGGIAHDLRNPLGAIKNASFFIKRKLGGNQSAEDTAKIAEFLDVMETEIARSNDVITNLLSFGANKPVSLSEIEISDVIDNSLSGFVMHENIDCSIELDSGLPMILGDSTQLTRVIHNLLGNAQDAMKDGGRMTIAAQEVQGSIEIVVSDTGCGINPENIQKVFDPSYSGKSSGTGLGLAICYDIINKHHGSISVDSQIGVGTSFVVRVPTQVDLENQESVGRNSVSSITKFGW